MKFALGLDVHKETTAYALVDEKGKAQERGETKTSPKSCLDLVSHIPPTKIVIGMEASTCIYPLYDAFTDAGYIVKVANPVKLRRITQSDFKDDDKDALDIALQLLRNDFPESYMLSKEMRDKREIIRQHMRLTQEKTRVKNQIHNHIAKHNFRVPCKLGTKKSFTYLRLIKLPEHAKTTLDIMVEHLEKTISSLQKIKKIIEQFAQSNEVAQKLMTIDGIGPFTAITFCFELGDWKRFKSVKQLTAYVALIPRMSGSAKKMHYGRIRKDGNHQMKYAFTRAAEQAIRKNNVFKVYFEKLRGKGKKRRTAIAAVANKLVRTCYGVLHT